MQLSMIKAVYFVCLITASLAAGYWWGCNRYDTTDNSTSSAVVSSEKMILYYRHPMGLPDTSPVPKKDAMGMDYLPVYASESSASDNGTLKIDTRKIQKLGVRIEAATLRQLMRTVRAVATIQPDERRLYTLTAKFEGWIQRLYVNTTGQAVKKGDILMDIYSPALIATQHEYLLARKGMDEMTSGGLEARAGMSRLAESALQRLRNWDIAETELKQLQREGIREYLPFRSRANGVVLEKPSIEGKRFEPGEILYQIADLSSVWVLADVFEQDISLIHPGQTATIRVDAYPEQIFNGEVEFIYPTITPETRTAIVRIRLPNPKGMLKPAMYAHVEFSAFHSGNKVLTVPDSAVLDTGTRQLVLVDLGEGRFEPRTVKPGIRADGYVEILGGLVAEEKVVVKANFLIDAESNLKAALSAFAHDGHSMPPDDRSHASPATVAGPETVTHRGEGSIEAIDLAHATITLAHGPIASLSWPAMRMDFRLADPGWLRSLQPGQEVVFDIIEQSAGEYIIVAIRPLNADQAVGHHGGH